MSRNHLYCVGLAVCLLAGCGKAPDATGEWRGDGEWHGQQAADNIRKSEQRLRVLAPQLHPPRVDTTEVKKAAAHAFRRFHLSLRADGTCRFGNDTPAADGADPRSRQEQQLDQLFDVCLRFVEVNGTWKQSRWRVTLTAEDGSSKELRLLDADTAEFDTDDGPLRFKRVR
jgi:hypothetical protein